MLSIVSILSKQKHDSSHVLTFKDMFHLSIETGFVCANEYTGCCYNAVNLLGGDTGDAIQVGNREWKHRVCQIQGVERNVKNGSYNELEF